MKDDTPPAVLAVQDDASFPAAAPLALVNPSVAAGLSSLGGFVGLGSHHTPLLLHASIHIALVLPIPRLRVLCSCMLYKVLKIGVMPCSLPLSIPMLSLLMPLDLVLPMAIKSVYASHTWTRDPRHRAAGRAKGPFKPQRERYKDDQSF